jgi:hypothetical protein
VGVQLVIDRTLPLFFIAVSLSTSDRMPTFAAFYHDYITAGRCAASYFVIVSVALIIALPIISVVEDNSKQQQQSDAQAAADQLAAYVDRQVDLIGLAVDLFKGFAASGAPLQVPSYFGPGSDAATRVQVAVPSNTTGLSRQGYARVLDRVSRLFEGFTTAVVQPGVVNAFTPNGSVIAGGDWLNQSVATSNEYYYMVNTTKNILGGPQLSAADNRTVYLFSRVPVFSNYSALSMDPTDLDADGHHVNWRYMWGGISVVMNLTANLIRNNVSTTAIDSSKWHWMIDSAPTTRAGTAYPYLVVLNSTLANLFGRSQASCASAPYAHVCARVMPREFQWQGDGIGISLAAATLGIVFGQLILQAMCLFLMRVIAGPKPNPLQFAPRRTPFHAVCIDMVAANKMWAEVPFLMTEITEIFTDELEALCEKHQVFVADRLGNTVVVTSAHRGRLFAFTQAFCRWACGCKQWPNQLRTHQQRAGVDFSFVLHTCSDVQMRADPQEHWCDVTGPDIQLLLRMRTAAIPRHIVCTSDFLGLVSEDRMAAFSRTEDTTAVSSAHTVPHSELLKVCREIGVCDIPVTFKGHRRTKTVRGFLVPSAATGTRELHKVLDFLPATVWAEWHPDPRAARHISVIVATGNPLLDTTPVETDSSRHSSQNTASRTATLNRAHEDVMSIHLNNEAASSYLPGTAIEDGETHMLATIVAPLVHNPRLHNDKRGHAVTQNASLDRRRCRAALSMATYFFLAYRVVFAPFDAKTRLAIITKISAANGVPLHTSYFHLAARCSRVCEEYLMG